VVVALEAGERVSGRLIPHAASFAVEIMLADQGLLDLNGT